MDCFKDQIVKPYLKSHFMKKQYLLKREYIVMIFSLFVFPLTLTAQFEQKVSVNASVSTATYDLSGNNENLGFGLGLDGGLQYNLNRRFSLFGNARFYYKFGTADYPDAYFDNLSFGGGLKINILPSKKINPYLYGEANFNLLWYEDYFETGLLDEFGVPIGDYEFDFGASIGGLGGAGFDISFNDHFTLFMQSGIYYIYYDESVSSYSQFGFRINLFKSKTI